MDYKNCIPFFILGLVSCTSAYASVGNGFGNRILDPGDDSTIVKPPHSQPWVVGIVFGRGKIGCGGTLISKKHVISAAHCEVMSIRRGNGGATHVIVGEHDQRVADGEQKMKISKTTQHPDYDLELIPSPDLIVYELEREVHNRYAKPAFLPKQNENFGKYTVSGWGYMNRKFRGSDVLRTVELADLGSHRSCYQIPIYDPISDICAENQGNVYLGPCNGDSGGPWIFKNERFEIILAGVHKAGNCTIDEVPHIAVKVSHPPYLTWIKQVTGIY